MNTNSKKRSILNFLLIITVLIAVNIISSFFFFRWDMTEEKRYTLSDFTKNILKNLDGDVVITVYLQGKELPVQFKKFSKAIEEMLQEFRVYGGKKINFKFVNPTSDELSDDEKMALYKHLYSLGIVPIETQELKEATAKSSLIFPSAVITYTYYDPKTDSLISKDYGLNLLNNDPRFEQSSPENINNSLQTLEYKFINLIYKVSKKEKAKIAFITGHGELPEPFVWDMEKALSEYYDVRRGRIGGMYGILDSFQVIIIAKPIFKFDEKDKFVIDQYLMKGGKILWLVDGVSADMDSVYFYKKTFAMPALPQQINIDDMLFTYGVRINTDLVKDLVCSKILLKGISKTGEERNFYYNWYYFPVLLSHNNHVINKYLKPVRTEFISTIDTVGKNPKIKKTVLLTSSEYSKRVLVNMPLEINFDEIHKQVDKQTFNKQYLPVAVLLEGQFPSLYKGRLVNKYLPKGEKFLEESVPTKMIVVADGDIIKNVVKSNGEPMPLDFDRFSLTNYPGNKEFLMNSVNYLTDDAGIMTIRNRQFKLRLLNQKVVLEQKGFWQIINMVLPVIFIIFIGVAFNLWRVYKYTKKF